MTGYAGRTDNLITDILFNVPSVQKSWLGELGTRINIVLGIVMIFAGYPVNCCTCPARAAWLADGWRV